MRQKSATLLLFSLFLINQLATAEPINRSVFTLQVASFPDPKSAQDFAARLSSKGLPVVWGGVELPGRGVWNRVFVGSFKTFGDARSTGDSLVARGLIEDFLVKQVDPNDSQGNWQSLTTGQRVNTVVRTEKFADGLVAARLPVTGASTQTRKQDRFDVEEYARSEDSSELRGPGARGYGMVLEADARPRWVGKRKGEESSLNGAPTAYAPVSLMLPNPNSRARWLSTPNTVSTHASMPRSNPVELALDMVGRNGLSRTQSRQGGLWLSGDTGDGLARLRWIVGSENADVIGIGRDGKVELDLAGLARVIGVKEAGAASAMKVVHYFESNEGLLLLVELTQGPNRYQLHIGSMAPTAGGYVRVTGSINLDNNFDSRINPYRRNQQKLVMERPPDGFDGLIAMNPQARWFNLPANRFVPVGHITFHELAEAYAKVHLGLDYLVQEARSGAHNLALEREKILQLQRPLSVILTAGSNRVLRLGEEMRLFYSEPGRSIAGLR